MTVADRIRQQAQEYSSGEERPLGSYLALMAVYGSAVAGMGAYAARRRGRLPARVAWSDLALLAVATHRFSRLVSKDPITSPLRAAFTRYEGVSGPAELEEQVRGHGPRKAIGELVTCPFCLSQWAATIGVFGLLVAPRLARAVAGTVAVVAVADALQFAYAKLEQA